MRTVDGGGSRKDLISPLVLPTYLGDRQNWWPTLNGRLMQTDDSLEKTLLVRKIEGKGEVGSWGWHGWMASPTQWTWTWANSRRSWGTGRPRMLQSKGLQRVWHNWATEQQQPHSHIIHQLRGWNKSSFRHAMFLNGLLLSNCSLGSTRLSTQTKSRIKTEVQWGSDWRGS